MNRDKILEILKKNLPHLNNEFGVKRIGVFGSFTKNTQNDFSDVDIVVEFERPIGLKFIDFTEYLEKILGRKTDVLTPIGISSIRNKEIAKSIEESLIYV